jgi:hypothetical protein
MPDREALLFANDAFYLAFAARDMAAMEEVWSKVAPVACIHPGWGALTGRDEVLESWAAIIANPDSPDIVVHAPLPHLYGDVGFVVCYEEIGGQYLIATNVFVRDGSIWRMVHHQAGPTAAVPEPDEGGGDSTPDRPN